MPLSFAKTTAVVILLSASFAHAAMKCSRAYHASSDIDFSFDSRINPAVQKQIKTYIYNAAVSDSRYSDEAPLEIIPASTNTVASTARSWGFSARPNDFTEDRLLTKGTMGTIPKSLALYKMSYEDGSVFYSDIHSNQNPTDDAKGWILGDQIVEHGLATDVWPSVLQQMKQRTDHGKLLKVEKMVTTEIPIVNAILYNSRAVETLPILDANYEGLQARAEQREFRKYLPGSQYVLSIVTPNGVTISKSIP